MPVFLLLAFFLLFLVQTSVIMIALQGALSQTVRTAASAWYPISLMRDNGGAQTAEDREPATAAAGFSLDGAKEILDEYGEWLPSPLREWAEPLANGKWTPEGEAAKPVFAGLTMELADSEVLKAGRFRIVSVELPREGNPSESFLTLEAEYRLPFRVPFTGRPLAVRASARERVWTGGTPSQARQADEQEHPLSVEFVSLEPNPVRPGRKATLVLRTRPGAVLDLSVLYKSGQSQAKHLGAAAADESGIVSWTWHVSGNTTSGEWNWEVKGEGGRYGQSFRVARANE
ncbi:hypothetical protein [Cohnella caldifontis]|uniref:hypothetical protein n=1 Tax=Cohnella caldifontis TaxID=3027471 RepID=UPI0023ED0FFF|nr:hypothetical protein [Cohnella sp. YIM B05605]